MAAEPVSSFRARVEAARKKQRKLPPASKTSSSSNNSFMGGQMQRVQGKGIVGPYGPNGNTGPMKPKTPVPTKPTANNVPSTPSDTPTGPNHNPGPTTPKPPKLPQQGTPKNNPVRKVKTRQIKVKKGQTLSDIAKQYFDDPKIWHRIVNHNKGLKGKHGHVAPGTKINIPEYGNKYRRHLSNIHKTKAQKTKIRAGQVFKKTPGQS